MAMCCRAEQWRLLAPMTALNGIMLIGWSTALIFAILAAGHVPRQTESASCFLVLSCRLLFSCGGALAGGLLVALAIAHAFELHAVRVEEEHGVIVVVIFAGRIDDGGALLFQKGLQRIDIVPAAQAKRVMVKADIALAVFVLLAFRVGGGDPEQRLAVGPAHHAFIFGLDAEAQELHQRRVEGLRLLEVADADHQMVDARQRAPWSLSFVTPAAGIQ